MKKYFKFTKAFIQTVVTEKLRERYYDTGVDGLVLSVTKSGNKSYYVKFWRADAEGEGCHVERVIGQAKNMTVDEARRKVRELKSSFIEEDPRKRFVRVTWLIPAAFGRCTCHVRWLNEELMT